MPDPTPSTMGDAAEDELVHVRVLHAPRELVFRCMVEPEHLTHFWGPTGMSTPASGITVDLRPGGAFETVMVADTDGSEYRMRAVYDEVVEPERLVWTEPDSGMTSTTTFTDLGDGTTRMRIHQSRVPAAYRSAQAQAGFLTSLDRFETYLADGGTVAGPPNDMPWGQRVAHVKDPDGNTVNLTQSL